MKLIKLLSEEFPMFDQFGDDSLEGGAENPTGLAPEGEEGLDLEANGNDCQCQCTCPCCQSNKNDEHDDLGPDGGGPKLDFSAKPTGMEKPKGDDEFEFNV